VVLLGTVTEKTLPIRAHGCQEEPPAEAEADIQQHIVGQDATGSRGDEESPAIESHEVVDDDGE